MKPGRMMTPNDAQHSANVSARWRELESGRLARVIAIVNEQALPIKARHHKRVNSVIANPVMTVHAKIEALWDAVDEIGAIAKQHAACRRGCSHCCHTSVLLPAQEAALIGKRIGVKPEKVTGITGRDDIDAGYDNPCPFLTNGSCAIYASRPLACRQQFNMDSDALLCQLIGAPSKVPYLNLLDYHSAMVMITATQREGVERDKRTGLRVPVLVTTPPDVGDIREFFPRGIK